MGVCQKQDVQIPALKLSAEHWRENPHIVLEAELAQIAMNSKTFINKYFDLIDDKYCHLKSTSTQTFQAWNAKSPAHKQIVYGDRVLDIDGTPCNESNIRSLLLFPQPSFTMTVQHPIPMKVFFEEPGLGLTVGFNDDSVGVLIQAIRTDGLVQKWNIQHPHQQLLVGDRIVAVDGRVHEPRVIASIIENQASALTLTVFHYPRVQNTTRIM